ncbi:MAG: Na+/H+ antiporter subunit E [Proteobacteria bacterium]|nr:Na+/H+ antiporter subunit E [Burkholderiales bacterium]
MRRLFPAPLLSAALFIAWLLLNGAAPAQLALGAVLATAIPWLTEPVRVDRPRFSAWPTLVRLGFVVLFDIVVSNVRVARLILGPEARIDPRFVWVPLTIRDPHGIVALAGIITLTPGTLSSDLSDDRRHLLVHCLNAGDEALLIATIKQRYEAPLIRIFEGAR